MKKRNFKSIAAMLLVLTMLFSMVTLASAKGTEVPTTTPSGETETTDGSYDDGYNDGYDHGYSDGYFDGYGSGWYDGYYNGAEENKDIFTIIRERIEEIRYNIQNFFKELRKKFLAAFGLSDIDKNYLPSADIANLGEDTEAYYLCKEFNEKMEALNYPMKPISYVKTAKVGIDIVDCTGGKLVAGIVNPVVESYLVDDVTEYEYEQYYAPGMQVVYVTPEGLKSATKTVNEDGTTDYEFVLIEEATFFDGEDDYLLDSNGELSFGNFYNYDVADVLLMSYFDADPVKIKRATIRYPGTTVKATADAEGRITALDILMPVEGSGKASAYLLNLNVEAKGYRNEGFTITYPEININPDGLPDGSEATLEENAEATALCEEFNTLFNGFSTAVPDTATIKRTRNIDAEASDVSSVVESVVNPIIESFTGETVKEETVNKGEMPESTPYIELYPVGLITAEKTANEDGTTDYKFVLAKEAAHFDSRRTYGVRLVDGKVTECSLQHNSISKAINFEYMDLGAIDVKEADFRYPGATITAKTDAQGRLVSYNVISSSSCEATASVGPINVTASFDVTDTDNFEIIYS